MRNCNVQRRIRPCQIDGDGATPFVGLKAVDRDPYAFDARIRQCNIEPAPCFAARSIAVCICTSSTRSAITSGTSPPYLRISFRFSRLFSFECPSTATPAMPATRSTAVALSIPQSALVTSTTLPNKFMNCQLRSQSLEIHNSGKGVYHSIILKFRKSSICRRLIDQNSVRFKRGTNT